MDLLREGDTVTIHFDGDVVLPVADVFPDGVPDPLTIADVIDAVRSAGDVMGLLRDWCLPAPRVMVSLYQDGQSKAGTNVYREVFP